MKNIDKLYKELVKPNTRVLLYGGDCTGKTPTMVEIVKQILVDQDAIIFSNQAQLRLLTNKKLNSTTIHKSSGEKMDIKSLKNNIEDVQFVIIDEYPSNLSEALKYIPENKNIFMTYKSESEENIPDDIKSKFNVFAQTKLTNTETKEKSIVSIERRM